MSKKVAVFGDVHGQANQLKRLIEEVKKRYSDVEFYSLGDLIDRGPDSKAVIQICIDEGVKGIIGNHDQWLQELVVQKRFDPFCIKPIMGGISTLLSYDVDAISDGQNYIPGGRPPEDLAFELYQAIPEEHREWVAALPPYRKIEVEGDIYWLLHAGMTSPNAANYSEYSDDEMMEIIVSQERSLNSILWPSPYTGGPGRRDNLFAFGAKAIQIFGHRPHKKPVIKGHFIAMDTGCGTCEPYILSAIILPDKEIISVGED